MTLIAEIDDGAVYLYDDDEAFEFAPAADPDAADAVLARYGYARTSDWRPAGAAGGRVEADIAAIER